MTADEPHPAAAGESTYFLDLDDGGFRCVCTQTSPGPTKWHIHPSPARRERDHDASPAFTSAAQPTRISMPGDHATT